MEDKVEQLSDDIDQHGRRVPFEVEAPAEKIWVHPWGEMLMYSAKVQPDYILYVRADTLSQPNSTMNRCAKCGNLFRYPPSDNKPDATTCAWCSQPNQKCVRCGHDAIDREGVCKYQIHHPKELYGNYPKRYCGCPCEFSQPNQQAVLEAAREICRLSAGNQWVGDSQSAEIIAAIISKHLSRGADQTDQGEMKAKNSGGVAAESLLTALAGRELDAAVAERVMGREILYQAGNISKRANEDGTHAEMWVGHPTTLEQCRKDCAEWNSGMTMRLSPMVKGNPAYSTSIAAAMEVVEKLGVEFTLGWLPSDDSGINWDASFGQDRDSEGGTCVYAETAPLAICRAALMYVEKHST